VDLKVIEGIVEAVLFASGDSVSLEKLSVVTEIDKKTLKLIIDNMSISYNKASRGLMIRELDGSYQLCTKKEYGQYISMLYTSRKKQGLSQPALETLAIIAYKQPVTRAEIEKIRGVNPDGVLLKLLEKNLIMEAGRSDVPGKPKLYGTTEEFLRSFGFRSIKDLPMLEMNEIESVVAELPVD